MQQKHYLMHVGNKNYKDGIKSKQLLTLSLSKMLLMVMVTPQLYPFCFHSFCCSYTDYIFHIFMLFIVLEEKNACCIVLVVCAHLALFRLIFLSAQFFFLLLSWVMLLFSLSYFSYSSSYILDTHVSCCAVSCC